MHLPALMTNSKLHSCDVTGALLTNTSPRVAYLPSPVSSGAGLSGEVLAPLLYSMDQEMPDYQPINNSDGTQDDVRDEVCDQKRLCTPLLTGETA